MAHAPLPVSTTKESDSAQQTEIEFLQSAIANLKQEDQLLLTLFYEEDLSLNEIQQITGASISSSKSRLFQIRKRLKSIFEKENHGQ